MNDKPMSPVPPIVACSEQRSLEGTDNELMHDPNIMVS
jgi:hypothetical protein